MKLQTAGARGFKILGPRTNPATISPTTSGCPTRRARTANNRAVRRITASCTSRGTSNSSIGNLRNASRPAASIMRGSLGQEPGARSEDATAALLNLRLRFLLAGLQSGQGGLAKSASDRADMKFDVI